ncbi:MAG: DUF3048 domain-containing protein [Candidatus Berkelbacteria bacterium]|nr:DUF3048 domain-containing protein [Candidatus Berkelbacteria bacterium]MCR4307549.1 DUF3048 domain-containing protein [Candidatus Berkelbacteria bacterium]
MEGETSRFKLFFINHKKFFVIVLPILIVVAVAAIFWIITKPNSTEETPNITLNKKNSTNLVASLTNGVMVTADIANRHPVAVMIENSPDARPQAGLNSADIVYEAVTEGGITRFMGIFSQNYPTKAGPVRSARSYFIDWLSEYDAFYAHAGGSPAALSRISSYGIKDYPHSNDAYTRIPQAGIASEHTLFVDVSKIYNLGVSNKKWPSTYTTPSWKFKEQATTFGTVPKITLNFSTTQFQTVWTHDSTANTYSRVMNSVNHNDRVSGEQITAKSIVVMTVSHSANPPYAGTGKESEWTMTTIGSGAASVFQDGTRTEGTWKKPSRLERTRFYDSQGVEIPLNRGKIWVEILPQDGSIVAPSV